MSFCEACKQRQGEIITSGVYGFFTLCASCCNNLYKLQERFYVNHEELPDKLKERTKCGGWDKSDHEFEEELLVIKLDAGPTTDDTSFLFFCRECFLDFLKDVETINRIYNLFSEIE